PAERNTGSLQKLLLVAFGALTLAGLTGNAVYRLARRRARRQDWLRERTGWQSEEKPLDPPWGEPQVTRRNPTPPALGEAHELAVRSDFISSLEADNRRDRVEKIEEFLARLTKQLQAELESTRTHEAGTSAPSR